MKQRAQTEPTWDYGFADESWWSRVAQPHMHAWTDGDPVRLYQKDLGKVDPEPKAVCCYGVLRLEQGKVWLRFVDGRPESQVTIRFLEGIIDRLNEEGKQFFVLIGDNASWHKSQMIKEWIRHSNQQARKAGTVRLLPCLLPTKSPWLNPIEPHWIHAKRAIVEPIYTLTAVELIDRVCRYVGCEHLQLISKKIA